jgi:hypothetical protein
METKGGIVTEIKDADKGTFVSIFATLNTKDHDGDVTLPGAFTDGAMMPVSAYGHSSWNGNPPVGKAKIKTVGDQAQAHGSFFMDTQAGSDTFKVVKSLAEDGMGEWSYGYDAVEKSYGEWPTEGDGPKDQVRFLRKQKVHEVSPVLLGAGIDTVTVSAKGLNLDDVTDDDLRMLLRGASVDRLKSILPEAVVKALAAAAEVHQETGSDDTLLRREQLRYESLRFATNGR